MTRILRAFQPILNAGAKAVRPLFSRYAHQRCQLETAPDPPWLGRSKICLTIMFLLLNKSREKGLLQRVSAVAFQ